MKCDVIRDIVSYLYMGDFYDKNYDSVNARRIYVKLCKEYFDVNNVVIGNSIGESRFNIKALMSKCTNHLEDEKLYINSKILISNRLSGVERERLKLELFYQYKEEELKKQHEEKIKILTKGMSEFEEILSLPKKLRDNFINTRIIPYLKFHKNNNISTID